MDNVDCTTDPQTLSLVLSDGEMGYKQHAPRNATFGGPQDTNLWKKENDHLFDSNCLRWSEWMGVQIG